MRKPEIAIYYFPELDRIRIVYINNKHLAQIIIDYDYDSMSTLMRESMAKGYDDVGGNYEKIGEL